MSMTYPLYHMDYTQTELQYDTNFWEIGMNIT